MAQRVTKNRSRSKVRRYRPHLRLVVCFVFAWLFLGVSLPLLVDGTRGLIDQNGPRVIASPGTSFQITKPVVLSMQPSVVVERGTIMLVDSNGQPAVGAALLERLKKGRGYLRLLGGQIRIGSIDQNAARLEAASDLPVDPILAAFRTKAFQVLFLSNTNALVKLPGKSNFTVRDITGRFDLSRAGQLSGSAKASVASTPVKVTLKVSDAQKVGEAYPLFLRLNSDVLNLKLDGRLMAGRGLAFKGAGQASGKSLRRTVALLGGNWTSGGGLKAFTLTGELGWTEQAIAFDKARVSLDGNHATGTLALGFKDSRPSVSGTLAFKTLALDGYISGAAPKSGGKKFDWSSLLTTPFRVPIAKQIDADIRLSAARVEVAGVSFDSAAASIALKNGRLLADIAQFEMSGGQGSGQIGADFRGYWPTFTLRGKLRDVDFTKTSMARKLGKVIQGKTGISAQLTAEGVTLKEMMRTVNGTVILNAKAGGGLGVDILGLLAATKRVPQIGWGRFLDSVTSFEKLNARLIAKNGTVIARHMQATSGQTLLDARGSVDLLNGRVDVRVDKRSITIAANGAKTNLGKSSRRLEIKGPMSAPLITSQTVPAATDTPSNPISRDGAASKNPPTKGP